MNIVIPLLATAVLFLCCWIYTTGREIHRWMDRIRPLMADGKERSPFQVERDLGSADTAAIYCALQRLEELGELSSRVEAYYATPRIYYWAA